MLGLLMAGFAGLLFMLLGLTFVKNNKSITEHRFDLYPRYSKTGWLFTFTRFLTFITASG